jgi:hypothetical protein
MGTRSIILEAALDVRLALLFTQIQQQVASFKHVPGYKGTQCPCRVRGDRVTGPHTNRTHMTGLISRLQLADTGGNKRDVPYGHFGTFNTVQIFSYVLYVINLIACPKSY